MLIIMNLIVGLKTILLILSLSQIARSHQQQQQQPQHHNQTSTIRHRPNLEKLQAYLTPNQQQLVTHHKGSLLAVARAIKIAIKECQYQMRNELWDCPTYGFSVRPTDTFGALMSRNFKETSFVQSLLSAALVHSVSRACTESIITTCSRRELRYDKGLGEDIEFGRNFARDFMYYARPDATPYEYATTNKDSTQFGQDDKLSSNSIATGSRTSNKIEHKSAHWRERNVRREVSEHNYEVGGLTVKMNMKKQCKCHGISGSQTITTRHVISPYRIIMVQIDDAPRPDQKGACTMQTCWDRLPEFKDVAKLLHDGLDRALQVKNYKAPSANQIVTTPYKSLTPDSPKKSNKKRSSSASNQHQSYNLSNGFGRSAAPIGSDFSTKSIAGGTSISDIDGVAGVGSGGRLQAHQEVNMNSINSDSNGASVDMGGSDTGVDMGDSGGLDKQSPREFAQNTVQYSAMLAAAQQQSRGNTTGIRRRPVARSIGLAASKVAYDNKDLIYTEESLDYCNPNERYNIKGTKGRICSEKRTDANSCETLCCGRGYSRELREERYTCDCKFQYCCVLKCNTCTRKRRIYKCR